MANRTPQLIGRAAPVTPTYNAAASGDTFNPGDTTHLHVKNAGSSVTLTVTAVAEVGGLEVEALVVTCGVGETIVGPFPASLFANATDGLVHMVWSSTTSVTWAALTLGD